MSLQGRVATGESQFAKKLLADKLEREKIAATKDNKPNDSGLKGRVADRPFTPHRDK